MNFRAPVTGAGCVVSVVDPSPSCPRSFAPQHQAVLSAAIAQACRMPALSAVSFAPPRTATGDLGSVRAPSPSCPCAPHPQHHAALSLAIPQVKAPPRSEEHTSELQSHLNLVCRL